MYIIVGLGNPGKKYEHTRHNAGFDVLDIMAEEYDIKIDKIKHKALIGIKQILYIIPRDTKTSIDISSSWPSPIPLSSSNLIVNRLINKPLIPKYTSPIVHSPPWPCPSFS